MLLRAPAVTSASNAPTSILPTSSTGLLPPSPNSFPVLLSSQTRTTNSTSFNSLSIAPQHGTARFAHSTGTTSTSSDQNSASSSVEEHKNLSAVIANLTLARRSEILPSTVSVGSTINVTLGTATHATGNATVTTTSSWASLVPTPTPSDAKLSVLMGHLSPA